jgi:hypothetical protein
VAHAFTHAFTVDRLALLVIQMNCGLPSPAPAPHTQADDNTEPKHRDDG